MDTINIILAKKGKDLCSKEDLSIEYHFERFSRLKTSKIQNELEKFMNDNWKEKVKSNPRIYNASKFRLADFQLNDGNIKIQIGITSYKVCISGLYLFILVGLDL